MPRLSHKYNHFYTQTHFFKNNSAEPTYYTPFLTLKQQKKCDAKSEAHRTFFFVLFCE